MRRLLRPLAVLGLSGVVVPFAVGGTVLASFLYLPLPAALPPTKPGASEVSHLLDAGGHEFGQFHAFGENIPVAEQDVPAVLHHAFLPREGRHFYDAGAASRAYFPKPVSQLNASEAAMLAGLIPAPSLYDPLVSPDLAEHRRVVVLGLMRDQHYLTPEDYAAALAQHVTPAAQAKPGQPATVFYPPQQPQIAFPYFEDYVRRYLLVKLG